jgi:putative transcriptional regulator
MMAAIFDDMMTGLDEVKAFLAGKSADYRVTVPEQVDVKSIRKRLHMTQAGFSAAFGFSLDAVKHWEGGRRNPEASARAFLTVISKNPEAVFGALHPVASGKTKHRVLSGKEAKPKGARSLIKRTSHTAKSVTRAA